MKASIEARSGPEAPKRKRLFSSARTVGLANVSSSSAYSAWVPMTGLSSTHNPPQSSGYRATTAAAIPPPYWWPRITGQRRSRVWMRRSKSATSSSTVSTWAVLWPWPRRSIASTRWRAASSGANRRHTSLE